MPVIKNSHKIQKNNIAVEGEQNEDTALSVYSVIDSNGKEYKVGPGLFMVDNIVINTEKIIAGEELGMNNPGMKLKIDGVQGSIYFYEKNHDIDIIQNLIIVSKNLLKNQQEKNGEIK